MVVLLQTVALISVVSLAHGTILSATACFGTQSQTCDFFTLECSKGTVIKVLSAQYGVKKNPGDCKTGRRCRRGSDGCCAYKPEDCHEYFSSLHAYNLYRECSFKKKCGPLPAPSNILRTCENGVSSYINIEYECIPESTVLPFCNGDDMSRSEVNLVFDKTTAEYEPRTRCDCFVFFSSPTLDVFLVDVRMNQMELSGSGTTCSSAVLTDLSKSHLPLPQCSNRKSEEDNFIYNDYRLINDSFTGFELSNLYTAGPDDEPTLVWLSIRSTDDSNLAVSCTRTIGTTSSPTTAASITDKPGPINGSMDGGDDDDDGGGGNTGAVVAGVIVPILILAIIGAVIGYLIWRRKKGGIKSRDVARKNSYVEEVDREIIYDEIGHVETVQDTTIYDPVYEPGQTGTVGSSYSQTNGHTYHNETSIAHTSPQVPSKVENKQSKNPLRAISSQTSRFFEWFKAQTSSHNNDGKNRGRESSQDSYDHIRSGNRPVIVRVTAPEEIDSHVYSHQNDKPTVDNPVVMSSTGGRISKDMSAIHVGESYIEFTFDKVDKNSPNLVRKDMTAEKDTSNNRPVPPSRPPPSPSAPPASPKLIVASEHPRSISPVTDRTKSPILLSPGAVNTDNTLTYDYAESQPSSRRSSVGSKSDVSDHSYNILEKQPMYDYANMDDDTEQPVDNVEYSGSSVYEDVDEKLRAESMKKHKSSVDTPSYVSGYEVPVSLQTRPVSTPAGGKTAQPVPRQIGAPDISPLKKELLEKKLKPVDAEPKLGAREESIIKGGDQSNVPSIDKSPVVTKGDMTYVNDPGPKLFFKQESGDSPVHHRPHNESARQVEDGVVKSDNVGTKDYEKAHDLKKDVRNIAKLFESRA